MTVGELIDLLETHHRSSTVVFKDPDCYSQIVGVMKHSMFPEEAEEIRRQTGEALPHNDLTIIWGD